MDLFNFKSEYISWEDVKNALVLNSKVLPNEQFIDSELTRGIMHYFKEQLLRDRSFLREQKEVSICAKYAPRIKSSLDRRTRFAHKLATELFPPEENTSFDGSLTYDEKVVRSYIRYQRLLGELSSTYKKQENEKCKLYQSFKGARLSEHKELWCSLKNRPLSTQVLTPTPMPVKIASYKELEPLLNFLKSELPIVAQYSNPLGTYMKFDKCAIFTDGRLDLCKQGIGSEWIEPLLDNMKGNKQITDFLSGNNISNIDGAKAIAKFLKGDHKAKIQTWYLAGNCIDAESIRSICDPLKDDKDVKYLWLKRNPLHPEGIKHIGNLLSYNQNIIILDLHNTAVFDEGMGYLVEGLLQNKSLRHLYVDANGITVEGIKPLAEYFKEKSEKSEKGITSLWISMNRLDDEGTILLLKSLKNYHFLKRLNIGSNRITWDSAKALYENLVDHKNLIMLDIGLYKATADMGELSNRVGDQGAIYLAKFISENKSVRLLSIIHNDISITGIEEIADGLQQNNTLLYLYYSQYGLSIPQKLIKKINTKLESNLNTIDQKYLAGNLLKIPRFVKHSEKIRRIGSIYRNKD